MEKLLKCTVLRIPLVAILFMITTMPSYAQLSDSLKNELRKVSDEMSENGNQNFLIVDALADTFIHFYSGGYTFYYKHDIVIINYNPLDEPANTRYVNKIKKYLYPESPSSDNSTSMSTRLSITFNDVFNPSSTFRKGNNTNSRIMKIYQDRTVINMLVADNLLDTTKKYKVVYNESGLLINNNPLDIISAAKYMLYFNKEGFTPKEKADELIIDNKNIKLNTAQFSQTK